MTCYDTSEARIQFLAADLQDKMQLIAICSELMLCLAKIRSRPERNQILNLGIAPKLNFWCENAVVPRGNSTREKNEIEPRTW